MLNVGEGNRRNVVDVASLDRFPRVVADIMYSSFARPCVEINDAGSPTRGMLNSKGMLRTLFACPGFSRYGQSEESTENSWLLPSTLSPLVRAKGGFKYNVGLPACNCRPSLFPLWQCRL